MNKLDHQLNTLEKEVKTKKPGLLSHVPRPRECGYNPVVEFKNEQVGYKWGTVERVIVRDLNLDIIGGENFGLAG